MIRASHDPSAMAWDIAENSGEWTASSSAVLLGVAGVYWFSTWFTSGLPLLALLATRRLRGGSVSIHQTINTPLQEDPALP